MGKSLTTGSLVKKRDKKKSRWVPDGLFHGNRSIPKKAY